MTFPLDESKINISTGLDDDQLHDVYSTDLPFSSQSSYGVAFFTKRLSHQKRNNIFKSNIWKKIDLKVQHFLLETFSFDVVSVWCCNSISLRLSLGTQTGLWPLSADLLRGMCVWGVTVSQQAHWERDSYHLKCLEEGLAGMHICVWVMGGKCSWEYMGPLHVTRHKKKIQNIPRFFFNHILSK